MAWLWSDDLARLLVEHGVADESTVAEWITTPIAFRVDDEEEPRSAAHRLLGVDAGRSVA